MTNPVHRTLKISPPGSGKGVGLVITASLASWPGSAIVIGPKCELAQKTWRIDDHYDTARGSIK